MDLPKDVQERIAGHLEVELKQASGGKFAYIAIVLTPHREVPDRTDVQLITTLTVDKVRENLLKMAVQLMPPPPVPVPNPAQAGPQLVPDNPATLEAPPHETSTPDRVEDQSPDGQRN